MITITTDVEAEIPMVTWSAIFSTPRICHVEANIETASTFFAEGY